MELLQLKYFKDAAELENFSKAAKKNMVPQPSISYAIKKLEDELGVLLFDRNGRKIFLNENGEYVYQKVSSILNTVDECTAYFANTNVEDIKLYIQDGDFFENAELKRAMENAKEHDTALHLYGLLSDGGVHSHITHLYALLEMAKRYEELVVSPETQTVCISHADCEADAQILASMLRRSKPPKDILIVDYEPVTGSHVGPGALALFFVSDDNVRNI